MKTYLLFLLLTITSFSTQAQFWEEKDSDFPTESTGISRFDIVDENIAWGIGYNGINPDNNIQQFSKTIDAGLTWTAGTISVGNVGLGIGDIAAIDDQIAYIAVYPRNANQQGGIWKTEDGGSTWNKITSTAYTSASSFINIVHFYNNNDGVAMGDPINNEWEIYTTSDAGATFNRIAAANIPSPQNGETGYLAQKATAGNSIWFTTNKGRVFHSTNLGFNWNVYQSPVSDFGGETVSADISFSDANKGILQTQSGVLYSTLNAGQTWSQITLNGSGNPYGDNIAYIPNSSNIVSVGSNPDFAGSSYSVDDGVTWTNIDTKQHVDVSFFDSVTGYSGGFTSNAGNTGVFKYAAEVLTVDNFAFAKAISLYPNPTSDLVNISSTGTIARLELINLSGQQIKVFEPLTVISLKELPAGMYLIKITTDQGVETLPIIKN